MSNLQQLFDQHATEESGNRFQLKFALFASKYPHDVIVETGAGISTLFLLDKVKGGKVYSIDTNPWCGFEVEHDNYELIKGDSLNEMYPLFKRTGAWDIVLTDGCHDIKWQTYEYEFAFGALKPDGYIAADDYTWGGHNAWKEFLNRHDLISVKMGDIEYARKPSFIPVFEDMEAHHKACLELAENAEAMWLEAGNKNTEIDWVRV